MSASRDDRDQRIEVLRLAKEQRDILRVDAVHHRQDVQHGLSAAANGSVTTRFIPRMLSAP
jgi:hypothetical protein